MADLPTTRPSTRPTTRRGARATAGPGDLRLFVVAEDSFTTIPLPAAGAVVIGRGEGCTVVIDDDSVSRRHARLQLGPPLTLEDLGSANGTRLRDQRLVAGEAAPLAVGDVIHLGTAMVIVQQAATGARPRRIWSHDFFEVRVEEECVHAGRGGPPFAVLRLHAGPATPPDALRDVLAEVLRDVAVIGIYGPGDYEALLTTTPQPQAQALAQRLVAAFAARGIGVRAGVACWPGDGRSADELVARAGATVLGSARVEERRPALEGGGAMKKLRALVDRVAASTISVLILGETGVGKELLAEAVHRSSPRAARPFLRLNCAALSETLLESELFGHERGAFTGALQAKRGLLESADGGTIFFDEIGDLPLSIQVKLLRVIEERQVRRVGSLESRSIDVRFVAATNRDLEASVASGQMRQDLFFRLNAVTLVIPPLRERVDEIEGLAQLFITEACRKLARAAAPQLAAPVLALLLRYSWPGNIRELRNVCERAVVLCEGNDLGPEHLPLEKMRATLASVSPPAVAAVDDGDDLDDADEDDGSTVIDDARRAAATVERRRIVDALAKAGGNQTHAALALGVSRRTLMKKLDRYAIRRPRKGR